MSVDTKWKLALAGVTALYVTFVVVLVGAKERRQPSIKAEKPCCACVQPLKGAQR